MLPTKIRDIYIPPNVEPGVAEVELDRTSAVDTPL